MAGLLYTKIALIMRYVLMALGAGVLVWSVYMTVTDLSRARKLRSAQISLGAMARLTFLPADKTGEKQVFSIPCEGSVGGKRICDVYVRLPGRSRVLFDYRITHGEMVITPRPGCKLLPVGKGKADPKANKNAKEPVVTLKSGAYIVIDGAANMRFEMLKRANRPVSPSNLRAYTKKGRS